MVLNFEEEEKLEKLKHNNKQSFEMLRHAGKMAELEKELEIAKAGGNRNGC